MKEEKIKTIIEHFITTANQFNLEEALALFAEDAVIDNVSVGEKFKNKKSIRNYLENFFVVYKTYTKLGSIKIINTLQATAQVDFTGDFGHETGGLNFTFKRNGLIMQVDAYLD